MVWVEEGRARGVEGGTHGAQRQGDMGAQTQGMDRKGPGRPLKFSQISYAFEGMPVEASPQTSAPNTLRRTHLR